MLNLLIHYFAKVDFHDIQNDTALYLAIPDSTIPDKNFVSSYHLL